MSLINNQLNVVKKKFKVPNSTSAIHLLNKLILSDYLLPLIISFLKYKIGIRGEL